MIKEETVYCSAARNCRCEGQVEVFIQNERLQDCMSTGFATSGFSRAVQVFLCVCFALMSLLVEAQERTKAGRAKADTAKNVLSSTPAPRPVMVKLTVDQEQAALTFAREHHPELAKLLEQLRRHSKTGFAKGIREIHNAVQRLERIRERQPARFDAEVENWKTDSQIRLLTAKWVMSQDPELEQQIRELLRQRQQGKINRLTMERDRLAERLQQLDNQIGLGEAELEADLVAEWDRLTKRTLTSAKARKTTVQKKTLSGATKKKQDSSK